MELYGANKQVVPLSAAEACALEVLEKTTVLNGKRHDGVMLRFEDKINVPNNYSSVLVQLSALEKRLTKNQPLKEKIFLYNLGVPNQKLHSKNQGCPQVGKMLGM